MLFTTIGRGTDHLTIRVKISTARTTLHELIDSDVTVNFISFRFIEEKSLTPEDLHASAVRGMNNRILAEASLNDYYWISIKVSIIKDTLLFRVLNLKNYDIILRLSWLRMQNLNINWMTGELISREGRKQLHSCNSGELLRDVDEEDTVVIIDLHIIMTDLIDLILQKYKEYEDVFSKKEAFKLSSERSELNMNICLKPDTASFYESLYNLSETELSSLHGYLKMNLTTGFICRSTSSAEALILFMKKKNDTLCLCVNYWGLNTIMIRDHYLLSLISEILNWLMRAKWFTWLNMIAVYNLLCIKSGQK